MILTISTRSTIKKYQEIPMIVFVEVGIIKSNQDNNAKDMLSLVEVMKLNLEGSSFQIIIQILCFFTMFTKSSTSPQSCTKKKDIT